MKAGVSSEGGRSREATCQKAALFGGLVLLGIVHLVAEPGLAATISLTSKPLTVYRTCTLTATPNTTTAETDSYVEQASANSNNGTAATMDVQSRNNANRRVYVRFDLARCRPSIPSSSTVTNALLRLFVTAIPGVCRTEDAFRSAASWTETGVTWNNQPFGTSVNNPPSSQRTDAITVGAAPCQNSTANVYVSGWSVIPDVQAFVSGTATNYGWMIRDDAENSATTRNARFSSKEANLLAQSPQLVITYIASP
ncbi:MAG TPA: DNRLRE domain-containing protein [Actinomycetota bacterium]